MYIRLRYIALPLVCLLFSCKNSNTQETQVTTDDSAISNTLIEAPVFNGDSAYNHVKNQVDFGPRVPGTSAHLKCFNYIVNVLKSYADTVIIQSASAVTFDKKNIPVLNIVASFHPKASKRILLCAHWDTRPFADQDTKDKNKPIPGANDGGSGVGVLLELARIMQMRSEDVGVDIVLFDAEDWGDNTGTTEDSYCLGSQYWAKNPHIAGYKADFGILLDMVGAPGAQFGFEGYSLAEAESHLSMVWSAAANAGYGNYFKNFQRGYVTDDHYYVMKYTRIPTIDIIDCDPNTESRFGKYWHTHADNMDAIDKQTLKAVGQTLMNVVFNY